MLHVPPQDLEDLDLMKIFDRGLAECVTVECDWYFAIESVVTLTDPNVLMDLMDYDVGVITTQLSQIGQVSNDEIFPSFNS